VIQKIRFRNKVLFEIETLNGIKYIKKEDKEASRRAGIAVFVRTPLSEIMNSDKEVINLK